MVVMILMYSEAMASPGLYDAAGEAYGRLIRVDTTVRLYRAYVLPVLMHGSELGLPRTLLLGDWIDIWSIRKILRMWYTRHVINAAIRETTSCPPVSSSSHIQGRLLRFFVRGTSEFQQDHRRVKLLRPASDWSPRAPAYHLAETDRCWCSIGQRRGPPSLEKGWRSHAL